MTREIHIKPVLNGFIVSVGCQTVVIDSRTKLIGELGRYLENPDAVESEYRKNAINDGWKVLEPGVCGQIERPVEQCASERIPRANDLCAPR